MVGDLLITAEFIASDAKECPLPGHARSRLPLPAPHVKGRTMPDPKRVRQAAVFAGRLHSLIDTVSHEIVDGLARSDRTRFSVRLRHARGSRRQSAWHARWSLSCRLIRCFPLPLQRSCAAFYTQPAQVSWARRRAMAMAAVAREVRVDALFNMSQMKRPEHHPEPSAAAALARRLMHAARIASGESMFFPAPVSERLQLVRCIHTRRGTGLRPRMRNRLEYHHGEVFVHLSRIHGEPRQAVS